MLKEYGDGKEGVYGEYVGKCLSSVGNFVMLFDGKEEVEKVLKFYGFVVMNLKLYMKG